jgi:hypothetical protein
MEPFVWSMAELVVSRVDLSHVFLLLHDRVVAAC